ncbi:hypothetical protein [Paracoccus albus]|uniref:hypothetical protein n=1 Tax=Paracoccus albus TaxID=3017784 RepID=UPI0022F0F3B1|nr:hypothetical protein [Paracoccus albus]WBU59220.1 hypothetical protein PAF20_10515 [Paracoccus albus]
MLGVLLSLGAVGLLGGMIARGVERTRALSGDTVAMIRTRRMTLASLRGVVSVPLWSPTSISMPLVITGLPSLSWWQIFPSGASVAISLLLIGWLTDRLSYARVPHRVDDVVTGGAALMARLALAIAFLPLAGGMFGRAIGISMISAILLLAPAVAIVWLGIQARGEGKSAPLIAGPRRFLHRTLPQIVEMRSELVIFGMSGALGALILPMIDVDALVGWIERFGLGAGWLLFLGYLFIVVTSILGLNAIVSVTLFVGVASQLSDFGLRPLAIALTALYSWSVAAGISPLSVSVRLASGAVGQSPSTVGFEWNGRYSLVVTAVAGLLCAVLGR